MANTPPDDLDQLIGTLGDPTYPGNPDQIKAKINAILSNKFVLALESLEGAIFQFQKVIGQRLQDLNQELVNNRAELQRSSEAANKHAKALVFTTIGLVVATVFMAGVGFLQLRAAQQETQSHIEPEMSLEIVNDDGGKVIISNDGLSPLVNVLVESDTAIFLGPPFNRITSRSITGRRIPGKEGGWWLIKELKPGEVQTRSIKDVTDNAFMLRKMLAEAKAHGQMGGISPKAKVDLRIILRFKMTVHRQVDNKQFHATRIVELFGDKDSGKPILWDSELMRYLQTGTEEVLKQL